MSGDYTGVLITPERRGTWAEYEYAPNIGVLVSPVERRGTWAEYEYAPNIGVLVSPVERRGTWAEYGEDERRSYWSVGISMSRNGWSVS